MKAALFATFALLALLSSMLIITTTATSQVLAPEPIFFTATSLCTTSSFAQFDINNIPVINEASEDTFTVVASFQNLSLPRGPVEVVVTQRLEFSAHNFVVQKFSIWPKFDLNAQTLSFDITFISPTRNATNISRSLAILLTFSNSPNTVDLPTFSATVKSRNGETYPTVDALVVPVYSSLGTYFQMNMDEYQRTEGYTFSPYISTLQVAINKSTSKVTLLKIASESEDFSFVTTSTTPTCNSLPVTLSSDKTTLEFDFSRPEYDTVDYKKTQELRFTCDGVYISTRNSNSTQNWTIWLFYSDAGGNRSTMMTQSYRPSDHTAPDDNSSNALPSFILAIIIVCGSIVLIIIIAFVVCVCGCIQCLCCRPTPILYTGAGSGGRIVVTTGASPGYASCQPQHQQQQQQPYHPQYQSQNHSQPQQAYPPQQPYHSQQPYQQQYQQPYQHQPYQQTYQHQPYQQEYQPQSHQPYDQPPAPSKNNDLYGYNTIH